jgi:hypothetical protein
VKAPHPLFGGVGIIESDYKLTLVHLGKELVEDCRFGVANMKVARRLGRETGHDLTLDGIL